MDEIEKLSWFSEGLRFQCTGCGQCCTGSPGYVFLSSMDLHRLAKRFKLSPEAFSKKYTRFVEESYALLDHPNSFDCVFLKDKKCSVYEDRPIQCRTFPWWLHHLQNKEQWEETAQRCEGVNHPEAPLVSSLHIQKECLTYLDNLLDQNFSL